MRHDKGVEAVIDGAAERVCRKKLPPLPDPAATLVSESPPPIDGPCTTRCRYVGADAAQVESRPKPQQERQHGRIDGETDDADKTKPKKYQRVAHLGRVTLNRQDSAQLMLRAVASTKSVGNRLLAISIAKLRTPRLG